MKISYYRVHCSGNKLKWTRPYELVHRSAGDFTRGLLCASNVMTHRDKEEYGEVSLVRIALAFLGVAAFLALLVATC